MDQAPVPESLGSVFNVTDSDCEFGTNCPDFTVCDDDEIIARIDPPVDVASHHVVAEPDSIRPHSKKDDSSTSLSGAQQVTKSQLVYLDSVKWAPGIVDLTLENPSNEITTVSTVDTPFDIL